jgi:hypothetical protein
VYNPEKATQGVLTVAPGTLEVVLRKYGRRDDGALEKLAGLTHATCSPLEML